MLLFWMSWTPVLLLTIFAVGLRQSALALSIYSFLYAIFLVRVFFQTPFNVIVLACIDGLLTTLPLVLVIFTGILLSSLLLATGSLRRIVEWLESGVQNRFHRNILITLGIANFMEGASVIAEPVVAPMLRAAGVAPLGAAALSIIGYAGLMTLELTGVIVTVLALITGIPATELAVAAAWLSIPATVLMAACIPFFLPHSIGIRRLAFVLLCGLVVGSAALGVCVVIGYSVSGIMGGLALIVFLNFWSKGRFVLSQSILKDLAPFGFMLAALLSVNMVPALKELTFERLQVTVSVVPVHAITLRPLFSAYLYLLCAFALSAYLLRVPATQIKVVLSTGFDKGWRAAVAMALFGAMGQVIAFSGYSVDFAHLDQAHNIPWIISHGLKDYTGQLFPLFVPFLGWVGTFLTGYGVASLMLFAPLQVQAAPLLNISATGLSAGLAVGASIGSISSPFKIAIAAPMCGALGKEGEILRWTIPLGIGSSLLIGLLLWLVL